MVFIIFLALQIPIIAIRIVVRIERLILYPKPFDIWPGLLLADFLLRTLYLLFDLCILMVFLMLVRFYVARKRDTMLKERLAKVMNEAAKAPGAVE